LIRVVCDRECVENVWQLRAVARRLKVVADRGIIRGISEGRMQEIILKDLRVSLSCVCESLCRKSHRAQEQEICGQLSEDGSRVVGVSERGGRCGIHVQHLLTPFLELKFDENIIIKVVDGDLADDVPKNPGSCLVFGGSNDDRDAIELSLEDQVQRLVGDYSPINERDPSQIILGSRQ